MATPHRSGELWGLRLLVLVVAALPFASAYGAEFVHFDDYHTVVENEHWRGFGFESLGWMFGSFYNGHYHPLTWLSFALDEALWGMDPRGFHLTNLLLHACNGLLVFALLRQLLAATLAPTQPIGSSARSLSWAAALGALFFAWHPMRVESVAWVTERRDLLSSFFWLWTIRFYLSAHGSDVSRGQRRRATIWALCAYSASLLAKAWGITLPAVLLLLDARPLRRWSRSSTSGLLLEKLPFIALAAVFAYLAALAQSEKAALDLQQHSLSARFLQSGYGALFYPLRTLVPLGQSPLHPIADVDFGAWRFSASALFAVLIPVTLAVLRRWSLLVAWAIYFVIVSPVLGLLQSGPQLVAERYSYLSCLPFAACLAVALTRALEAPRRRLLTAVLATAALLSLFAQTVRFTRVWHDSESLWSRVIEVYPDTFRSHFGLAGTYLRTGRPEEAAQSYRRCTELSPELYEPWAYLADLQANAGQHDEALISARRAYKLDARPEAMLRMAHINAALGRTHLVREFCAQIAASPHATPAHRDEAQQLQARIETTQ